MLLPELPARSSPYAPSSWRGLLPVAAPLPVLAKRLVGLAVRRSPAPRLLLLLLAPRAGEGSPPEYAVRKACVADVWLRRLLVNAAPGGALWPRGL
jgi:hypothetical protein